ncbi:hypothetical protein F183_A23450 [Bryobacterales bacterium F-183]|nr:hypothetical protein F183_A23450 [Bryobacterales bacterium F-183]
MGRALITIGLLLVAAGVLLIFAERLPFRVGKLPGDIEIRERNSVFYFPLATSLVLSVLLSLGLWLFNRFFR